MNDVDNAKKIAAALKFLKRNGISQKQVANRIGLSESIISKSKNWVNYEYYRHKEFSRFNIFNLILEEFHLDLDSNREICIKEGWENAKEKTEIIYCLCRVVDSSNSIIFSKVIVYEGGKVTVEIKGKHDRNAARWIGSVEKVGPNLFLKVEKQIPDSKSSLPGLYCFYIGNHDMGQGILLGTYSRVTRNGNPVAGKVVLVNVENDEAYQAFTKNPPYNLPYLLRGDLLSTPQIVPADFATQNVSPNLYNIYQGKYVCYFCRGVGTQIKNGYFQIASNWAATLELKGKKFGGWLDDAQGNSIGINLFQLNDEARYNKQSPSFLVINFSKSGRQNTVIPGMLVSKNEDNIPYSQIMLFVPVDKFPEKGEVKMSKFIKAFFNDRLTNMVCPSYSDIEDLD